ncbi:hypothetical protein EGT07_18560 [Herbaspirillum sp. HC18]|nr:hypothetical protein EGT07_18560 [Herbaspirillum sp. HC18]
MLPCSCCFCSVDGLACVGVLASPLLPLLCAAGGIVASDGGLFSAGNATDPPGGAGELAGEAPDNGSTLEVFGSGAFWQPANNTNANPANSNGVFNFIELSSYRSGLASSKRFRVAAVLSFDQL